ncbi:MAG: PH domain-containing protein [Actinomyces sp.]|nr:PH domain-containing protein [Actinomyces sp.]
MPGRVGTLLTGAGTAWAVITVWLVDGTRNGLQALGCGLFLMLAVWCLWWAPQLIVADAGITVRNAWRTYLFDWDEVDSCRTRWGLEVITRSGHVAKVSAAQRAGGLSTSFRRRQELRERELVGSRCTEHDARVRREVPEEYLGESDSVFRAHLDADTAGDLLLAYKERRVRGAASRPSTGRFGSRWNPLPVCVAIAAACALLAGTL